MCDLFSAAAVAAFFIFRARVAPPSKTAPSRAFARFRRNVLTEGRPRSRDRARTFLRCLPSYRISLCEASFSTPRMRGTVHIGPNGRATGSAKSRQKPPDAPLSIAVPFQCQVPSFALPFSSSHPVPNLYRKRPQAAPFATVQHRPRTPVSPLFRTCATFRSATSPRSGTFAPRQGNYEIAPAAL